MGAYGTCDEAPLSCDTPSGHRDSERAAEARFRFGGFRAPNRADASDTNHARPRLRRRPMNQPAVPHARGPVRCRSAPAPGARALMILTQAVRMAPNGCDRAGARRFPPGGRARCRR